MDIKTNLQLLSEAAAYDTTINTKASVRLDTVREAYNAIPEMPCDMVTEAADVVVNAAPDGNYYVEMTNLAPFMLDSGIKSISKALDLVAEANILPDKSVGLVIESQAYIESTLNSARAKADATGNYKILEAAISKVNKNNAIVAKLLSEGYKVAKKNDNAKVCPDCGKSKDKCTCEGCDGANCDPSTKNEAALLEAKVYKSKKELKAELDKLERSPKPIESFGKYAVYLAKALGPAIAAGAAVYKLPIGGIESLGVAAALMLVTTIMDCCTRINRFPGSISDKKVQYKKILNSIDASITAWKKKDSDNAEKMIKKLEEAKTKVQAKLDEVNKASKGKDLYYQNYHTESDIDEFLSFDDIKLD